jgi:hypothetical protein
MPEFRPYESVLSREAVAFVVGLSKNKQRLVLDLADQIAKQPSRSGIIRRPTQWDARSKISGSKVFFSPIG